MIFIGFFFCRTDSGASVIFAYLCNFDNPQRYWMLRMKPTGDSSTVAVAASPFTFSLKTV